jgi:hypothetical protein
MVDDEGNLCAYDVNGVPSQWGMYLSPQVTAFQEVNEISLQQFNAPCLFEALLWARDRRLDPNTVPSPLNEESKTSSPLGSSWLQAFALLGHAFPHCFAQVTRW